VTEIYICEVADVILHLDQLYVFRVHPHCEECLRLAKYSPGFVQAMGGKGSPPGASTRRRGLDSAASVHFLDVGRRA
jgi:hypothetical protein